MRSYTELRIAAYIRVSTEEQALHGLSVGAQTEALGQWAKEHQARIQEFYVDAGVSGRKKAIKRPSLSRLLEDVKADKIDLIIFTKLDRWFRNVGEYYKVQSILEDHHVDWLTILEDYETTTSSGRLKVNIMLSVAQDEADRTSERIKVVFDSKRQRGEPVTGNVPLGYIIQDKHLVKDPETQEAIAAFFDHFLKYGSIYKAVEYMETEFGLKIGYQRACRVLDRSAYYGEYNGAECPAYITPEQHQQISAQRKRVTRKSPTDRQYLFSGLLVCGECGCRMGAHTQKHIHTETAEYNCRNHAYKLGCPNQVNIREADVETYCLDHLESALETFVANYEEKNRQRASRDIPGEMASVRKKLARLKELYINELIDLPTYKTDYASLNAKLEELATIQEQLKSPPNWNAIHSVIGEGWKEIYSDLDKMGQRAFWRQVLKEITLFRDRSMELILSEK